MVVQSLAGRLVEDSVERFVPVLVIHLIVLTEYRCIRGGEHAIVSRCWNHARASRG
jgi:hypothetical protein